MNLCKKLFFIFIYIWVVLTPHALIAEEITLVADEWPPFNAEPESGEEGFIVDVARAVFGAKGIRISYQILPWKRAVEMTRDGIYNGLIGASKTDAPGFVFPSEELSRNYISFYVKKGFDWKFENRKDVERVSLGVIEGYDYRQWLLDYIKTNQNNPDRIQVITGANPLQRNILKMLSERIDAVVDNEAVILNVARTMGVRDQLSLAGYGIEPSFIYIAFSPNHKNSERYAEILSLGIVELRRNGQLKAILNRYGLKDWK